jgi:hypothetical protein
MAVVVWSTRDRHYTVQGDNSKENKEGRFHFKRDSNMASDGATMTCIVAKRLLWARRVVRFSSNVWKRDQQQRTVAYTYYSTTTTTHDQFFKTSRHHLKKQESKVDTVRARDEELR